MLPAANDSAAFQRPKAVHPRTALPSVSTAEVIRTCANCGGRMEEYKCKLICHGCGYFLSCSDYY
jgi:hypothetical protein